MLLLDTHILVWLALERERLSPPALRAITDAESNTLAVASITLWEVAMLIQKRRVTVNSTASTFLELTIAAYMLDIIAVTPEIAARSVSFPDTVNKDPADRLILATADLSHCPLVTADQNLRKYEAVHTVW